MTKRRIMVSIPDDVIDAMTLAVDGVEVRSLSHLIEILCSREAAQAPNRTEARERRRRIPGPDVTHDLAADDLASVLTSTKRKHAKNKKARPK